MLLPYPGFLNLFRVASLIRISLETLSSVLIQVLSVNFAKVQKGFFSIDIYTDFVY